MVWWLRCLPLSALSVRTHSMRGVCILIWIGGCEGLFMFHVAPSMFVGRSRSVHWTYHRWRCALEGESQCCMSCSVHDDSVQDECLRSSRNAVCLGGCTPNLQHDKCALPLITCLQHQRKTHAGNDVLYLRILFVKRQFSFNFAVNPGERVCSSAMRASSALFASIGGTPKCKDNVTARRPKHGIVG